MTKEILTSESLIDIHQSLNAFAKHHQNMGGQEAHRLIKSEFMDGNNNRCVPKDMIRWYEGYDAAIKEVLSVLYRRFVP
jgi:hypothetical protein